MQDQPGRQRAGVAGAAAPARAARAGCRVAWRQISAVAGLWACAALAAGGNLLQNGSFEQTARPWAGVFGAAAEEVRVEGPEAAAGTGCLRFRCAGQAAGVDHPPLRLGRELSRRGTYRLSAMVRNDGVRAGNFGLRLYFHSAGGEFVAMLGGITVDARTPPHGWTRRETTFGRGTASPIPPGAATLTVRFSFWAEDGRPDGVVWLDDVALEPIAEAAPAPGSDARPLALLWEDVSLSGTGGPGPEGPARVLEAAGYAVRRVGTESLAAADALDAAGAVAVVLPYGEWYPAPLAPALAAFLGEGGLLVTWGAGDLSRPLYPSARGWLPADAGVPGPPAAELSFASGWDLAEPAQGDRLELTPDAAGREARFRTTGLSAYAYRGTPLPPLPADDVVVAFEARGDRTTRRLCLELRERDGSRWKAVVPLTTEWTACRLHAGQFVSYANEKLGRADSVIRPRELRLLLVGMTGAMAGPGPHRFEIRALRLEAAAVPTETVALTPAFAGPEGEVARWFGPAARLPPRPATLAGTAAAVSRWECETLRVPEAVPGLAPRRLRGRFAGAAQAPLEAAPAGLPSPPADLGARLRAGQALERTPILRTDRGLWGEDGDAAALLLFRDGPLAGGRWLCVGIDRPDPASHPDLAGVLADALRMAREAILCDGLRPRFRVVADGVRLGAVLTARNPSAAGVEIPLRVTITCAGATRFDAVVPARVPGTGGAVAECVLADDIPISGGEWQELELQAEPAGPAPPLVGPLRFRLAARDALRQIAEFMLREASDDARLHGFSFIDSRGMRTLLAASDIFGRKEYRRAALRWGDTMLREQREDGGYRMGYGITPRGEECYVADGGEVAVAIARLADYTTGPRQAALLRSLEAYMGYREAFRVPGGGIGVGWCLRDYGRRPAVPLEVPTRILAPEMNTYTIGCSLAAACLHADRVGSVSLESRAAADAEWLMARTPRLHGPFVESFQYAHALARSQARRQACADYLRRAFAAPLLEAAAAGRSWWLEGGGRSALGLDGLAYVLHRLGDDPALRAELMRAACLMFSPDSPESVLEAIRQGSLGHDGWIYCCYGTLGLADVIQPMVTMEGPARRRAPGAPAAGTPAP